MAGIGDNLLSAFDVNLFKRIGVHSEKLLDDAKRAKDLLTRLSQPDASGMSPFPPKALVKAKGIAMMKFTKRGGLHARGMVFANLQDGMDWSAPSFFKITADSAELPAGWSTMQTLVLMETDGALQRFASRRAAVAFQTGGTAISSRAGGAKGPKTPFDHIVGRPPRLWATIDDEPAEIDFAAATIFRDDERINNIYNVRGSEATAKRLLRSDYPPPEVVALLYSVLRAIVGDATAPLCLSALPHGSSRPKSAGGDLAGGPAITAAQAAAGAGGARSNSGGSTGGGSGGSNVPSAEAPAHVAAPTASALQQAAAAPGGVRRDSDGGAKSDSGGGSAAAAAGAGRAASVPLENTAAAAGSIGRNSGSSARSDSGGSSDSDRAHGRAGYILSVPLPLPNAAETAGSTRSGSGGSLRSDIGGRYAPETGRAAVRLSLQNVAVAGGSARSDSGGSMRSNSGGSIRSNSGGSNVSYEAARGATARKPPLPPRATANKSKSPPPLPHGAAAAAAAAAPAPPPPATFPWQLQGGTPLQMPLAAPPLQAAYGTGFFQPEPQPQPEPQQPPLPQHSPHFPAEKAPQPAKTGAGGGSATAVAAIVIESQAPPADSDEPQTPTAADAGAAGHPFDSFGSPISAIEGAAECTAGSSPASSKEAQMDRLAPSLTPDDEAPPAARAAAGKQLWGSGGGGGAAEGLSLPELAAADVPLVTFSTPANNELLGDGHNEPAAS